MDSIKWMQSIVGDDSLNVIASRADLVASTLYRNVEKGRLPPEVVVAVARAYRQPVLPGLVAAGLITQDEADLKALAAVEALQSATDDELASEIMRRLATVRGDHAPLLTPINEL